MPPRGLPFVDDHPSPHLLRVDYSSQNAEAAIFICPATLIPNPRGPDGMKGRARSEIPSTDEAPFRGIAT